VIQATEYLLSKCETLSLNPSATKKKKKKSMVLRAGRVAQVVEHLPSKCKALYYQKKK
jgi:hypothetical protein